MGYLPRWRRPPSHLWYWWTAATGGGLILVAGAWLLCSARWPALLDAFYVEYSAAAIPVWAQVTRVVLIWWGPVILAQWLVLRRDARHAFWWVPVAMLSYLATWPFAYRLDAPQQALFGLLGAGSLAHVASAGLSQLQNGAVIAFVQWGAVRHLITSFWKWTVANAVAWGLWSVPTAAVVELAAQSKADAFHWWTLGPGSLLLAAAATLGVAIVQGYLLSREPPARRAQTSAPTLRAVRE